MRARARFLRLLGGLALVAAVFFASFLAAGAMYRPGPASAAKSDAVSTGQNPTPRHAPVVTPMVSDGASVAPTTDPPKAVVAGSVETTSVEVATTPAEPLNIDPVFAPIEAQLAQELDVAVRLPVTLGEAANDWSPTISSIGATGYVIHVGDGDDCNGASACRVSTFTARRSNSDNPQLPAGTPVPLPNDHTGIFIDSTCGTECNNGFIVWIEDGVRYSVGSRIASGPDVLDLAWRSIDTALPTPSGPEACGPGAPKHDGRVARTIRTGLDGDREMHWVAVCSELGFDLEIIEAPGELRWSDVDADGVYDAVIRHADGTTTIFAIDGNRPRGVIDTTSGGRLRVEDLACGNDGNQRVVVDRASGEQLDFINSTTVRRIPNVNDDLRFSDC